MSHSMTANAEGCELADESGVMPSSVPNFLVKTYEIVNVSGY